MYDAVYLSPHLDDVTLSCGGQIARQTSNGHSVLIVTVAAGEVASNGVSALGQQLHQYWQIGQESAVAARRQEDVQACSILLADFVHLDVPDAIYRVHPFKKVPLYASIAALAGQLHPVEMPLITSVVRQLQGLPPHRQLYVPLAVGNHVDHQLVRLAAEYCFSTQLCYYEDYPYAQVPELVNEKLQQGSWQCEVIPLSDTELTTKLMAVACFKSQISALFQNWDNASKLIKAYTNQTGGERIWQRMAH